MTPSLSLSLFSSFFSLIMNQLKKKGYIYFFPSSFILKPKKKTKPNKQKNKSKKPKNKPLTYNHYFLKFNLHTYIHIKLILHFHILIINTYTRKNLTDK